MPTSPEPGAPATPWLTRSAAISAGIVAVLVMNVQPALTHTLVQGLGFSIPELGAFASADVLGVAVGSLFAAVVMRRVSARLLGIAGLCLLVAADGCSAAGLPPAQVVAARAIGGFGGGLASGAAFFVFGLSDSERNIAFYYVTQTALALIVILLIPAVTATFGPRALFLLLALATIPALALTGSLPSYRMAAQTRQHAVPHVSLRIWIAVVGAGVFFLGQGALWTFLERVGSDSGLSEHAVATSLDICAGGGFLGCVAAVTLGERLTRAVPLLLSVCLNLVAAAAVRTGHAVVFAAAISLFYFSLPLIAAGEFAAIAAAERSGRAAVYVSASTSIGYGAAPSLGAWLVAQCGYASLQWWDAILVGISSASIVPLLLRRGARGVP